MTVPLCWHPAVPKAGGAANMLGQVLLELLLERLWIALWTDSLFRTGVRRRTGAEAVLLFFLFCLADCLLILCVFGHGRFCCPRSCILWQWRHLPCPVGCNLYPTQKQRSSCRCFSICFVICTIKMPTHFGWMQKVVALMARFCYLIIQCTFYQRITSC